MRRTGVLVLGCAILVTIALLTLSSPEGPVPPPRPPDTGSTREAAAPTPVAESRDAADRKTSGPIGEISGTVSTEEGGPVPGVRISLLDRPDTSPAARPEVHGTEFTVRGLEHWAFLEFSAPGFGTETLRGVHLGTRNLMVVMRPAGTIEGEAIEAETGEPVAGVGVWLMTAGKLEGRKEVTDGTGRFLFRDVPPGTRVLSLGRNGEDGWVLEAMWVRVDAGATARAILRLRRGLAVRFILDDREGAWPGPYEVSLSQSVEDEVGQTVRSTTVRIETAAGVLAESGACFGDGTVHVSSRTPWGSWSKLGDLALPLRDGAPVRFLLPAVTVLHGEVVGRDGKRLPQDGYVRASPTQGGTLTGKSAQIRDGCFAIAELRAGRYEVSASLSSGRLTEPVEVVVRPGIEGNHVALPLLDSDDIVEGTVVDGEGRGIPGARVLLVDGNQRVASCQADRDGGFRCTGLAPGRLEVMVQLKPAWTGEGSRIVATQPGLVRLPPITLRRSRLVRGRVRFPDAAPAQAALFAGGERLGVSGLDGTFSVYVDPSSSVLSAKVGMREGAPMGWSRISDEMEILLEERSTEPGMVRMRPPPDSHVRGRLVDAVSGQPIAGEVVELEESYKGGTASGPEATTGPNGRFELTLQSGLRWRIQVRSLRWVYHQTELFSVESGETRDVEIRLEAGRALKGRLLDTAGRPVAGEYVWYMVGYTRTDAEGRFEIPCTAPGQKIQVRRGALNLHFDLEEAHFPNEATFRLPAGR